MKNLYLILPLLFFSYIASGQPVISNVVPNFGDQFVLNQAELAASPGSSGANVTWDFSDQTIDEFTGNYTVKLPSEVEGSDMFPDASMVWTVDLEGMVLASFMSFENNTFSDYGTKSDFGGTPMGIKYTDPIDHFTYPLAYENSGSDDYSGSTFGATGDNSITGTESYIVDGYGTIITPFGTYENVLRITATGTETISVLGSEIVTERIQTSWYSSDYPIPVMVILTDESFMAGVPTESTETMSALVSYNSTSTGLTDRDNQNSFDIYPNPTADQITVKADGLNASSTLNIYSASGKLTKEVSLNGNELIDVSALSPGIYIAVMVIDGKRYAQKPFSVVR